MDMINKLRAIAAHLNTQFLEREELVEAIILSLVTGFPLAMISKPGTAKTAIVEELYRCVDGRAFSWLMTRYTTPDELAGALSLVELGKGNYTRMTDGTIVGADCVFLDEGFKANSATLNAQLDMLNAHRFEGHACPWVAWIAASNEYPDGIGEQSEYAGDSLEALWDRYILRVELKYIAKDQNLRRICFGKAPTKPVEKVTPAGLVAIRSALESVDVPVDVQREYVKLVRALGKAGCVVSDRKAVKGATLIKAAALVAGRDSVAVRDFGALKFTLWSDPKHRAVVDAKIAEFMPVHIQHVATALREIEDILADTQAKIASNSAKAHDIGSSLDKVDATIKMMEGLEADADLSQADSETMRYIANAVDSARTMCVTLSEAAQAVIVRAPRR